MVVPFLPTPSEIVRRQAGHPMPESATTHDLAIEVTQLERSFDSFLAVDEIGSVVRRGARYDRRGPNAVGKSTTADAQPEPELALRGPDIAPVA